ncbi:hypothetical protein ACIQRE_01795 [Streptomyces griseoluteus]|uniref:hypothetical protein n=1 Tax=Streptomyces griseoluteus TaxID=29306 RepID=UPI00382D0D31
MTPTEHAVTAADAIEELTRVTHRTGEGWEYPPQARRLLGVLARLSRSLPQAIEQTLLPVQHTHGRGRLTVDGGGSPDRAVQELDNAVRTAVQAAERLTDALDQAHVMATPLGVDTSGRTGAR